MTVSLVRRQLITFIFLLPTCSLESVGLDVRIGAFFPSATRFRDVYGSASPSYQIEASWRVRNGVHMWSNLGYIHKSGRSIPLNIRSKVQLVPISIGLKAVHDRNSLAPYIGVGLSYIWLHEKNCFDLSNKLNTVGAIFKSGITKKYKHFAFSLFGDYLIQKATARNITGKQRVTMSGFFLGGTIGVTF